MCRTNRPAAARREAGRGGPAGRRAIALLLVLVIISIGSVLAMSFLQAAGNHSVVTQGLVAAKKAEFLAESGMAEACYWLRHPELTGRAVWGGVQNRVLDAGASDYYNVTVTRVGSSSRYRVCSEGNLVDAGGEAMARTVSGDFQAYYGFGNAVAAASDLFVPASVTIKGNVYALNSVTNQGTIDGSVWLARTTISNSGTITGLTYTSSPAQSLGLYPTNEPIMYWSGGFLYSAAFIWNDNNFSQTWGADGSNPMGVWYRRGNMHLYGTTTVDGTLIVSGDLHICANSVTTITPKPGFPALVVRNSLYFDNDASTTTINGTVIVLNNIKTSGSLPNARVTINGALVLPTSGANFDNNFSTTPKVVINYDPTVVDVSGFYSSQPKVLTGALQYAYRADGG